MILSKNRTEKSFNRIILETFVDSKLIWQIDFADVINRKFARFLEADFIKMVENSKNPTRSLNANKKGRNFKSTKSLFKTINHFHSKFNEFHFSPKCFSLQQHILTYFKIKIHFTKFLDNLLKIRLMLFLTVEARFVIDFLKKKRGRM